MVIRRVPILDKKGQSGGHQVGGVNISPTIRGPRPMSTSPLNIRSEDPDYVPPPAPMPAGVPDAIVDETPARAVDTPRFRIPTLEPLKAAEYIPHREVIVDVAAPIVDGLRSLQPIINEQLQKIHKERQEEIAEVAKQGFEFGATNKIIPEGANPYTDKEYAKAFDRGLEKAKVMNLEYDVTEYVKSAILKYNNQPDKLDKLVLPKVIKMASGIEDPEIRLAMVQTAKLQILDGKQGIAKAQRKAELEAQTMKLVDNLKDSRDGIINQISMGNIPDPKDVRNAFHSIDAIKDLSPKKAAEINASFLDELEIAKWRGVFAKNPTEDTLEKLNQGTIQWYNPSTNSVDNVILPMNIKQKLLNESESILKKSKAKVAAEKKATQTNVRLLAESKITGAPLNPAHEEMVNAQIGRLPPDKQVEFTMQLTAAENISSIVKKATNSGDYAYSIKTLKELQQYKNRDLTSVDTSTPLGVSQYEFLNNAYTQAEKHIKKWMTDVKEKPWAHLKVSYPTNPAEAQQAIEQIRKGAGISTVKAPDYVIDPINNAIDADDVEAAIDMAAQQRHILGDKLYRQMIEPRMKGPKYLSHGAGKLPTDQLINNYRLILHGKQFDGQEGFKGKEKAESMEKIYEYYGTSLYGIDSTDTVKNTWLTAVSLAATTGSDEVEDEHIIEAVRRVSYGQKVVEMQDGRKILVGEDMDPTTVVESEENMRLFPAEYGLRGYSGQQLVPTGGTFAPSTIDGSMVNINGNDIAIDGVTGEIIGVQAEAVPVHKFVDMNEVTTQKRVPLDAQPIAQVVKPDDANYRTVSGGIKALKAKVPMIANKVVNFFGKLDDDIKEYASQYDDVIHIMTTHTMPDATATDLEKVQDAIGTVKTQIAEDVKVISPKDVDERVIPTLLEDIESFEANLEYIIDMKNVEENTVEDEGTIIDRIGKNIEYVQARVPAIIEKVQGTVSENLSPIVDSLSELITDTSSQERNMPVEAVKENVATAKAAIPELEAAAGGDKVVDSVKQLVDDVEQLIEEQERVARVPEVEEQEIDPFLLGSGLEEETIRLYDGIAKEWRRTGLLSKSAKVALSDVDAFSLHTKTGFFGQFFDNPVTFARDKLRDVVLYDIARSNRPINDHFGNPMSNMQIIVAVTQRIRQMTWEDQIEWKGFRIALPPNEADFTNPDTGGP